MASFVCGNPCYLCSCSNSSIQVNPRIYKREVTSYYLSGKTTVVFEELYQEDKQLAVHADLSDEDQQISFPEIGTQATDSETGEHMANADEKVKLIDTIQYKGLVPNLKYTATGTLMDAKTGEPVLINDKRVTAKTTFTPETSSGTVDVVFEFDGSSLAGKTTVVF